MPMPRYIRIVTDEAVKKRHNQPARCIFPRFHRRFWAFSLHLLFLLFYLYTHSFQLALLPLFAPRERLTFFPIEGIGVVGNKAKTREVFTMHIHRRIEQTAEVLGHNRICLFLVFLQSVYLYPHDNLGPFTGHTDPRGLHPRKFGYPTD